MALLNARKFVPVTASSCQCQYTKFHTAIRRYQRPVNKYKLWHYSITVQQANTCQHQCIQFWPWATSNRETDLIYESVSGSQVRHTAQPGATVLTTVSHPAPTFTEYTTVLYSTALQ